VRICFCSCSCSTRRAKDATASSICLNALRSLTAMEEGISRSPMGDSCVIVFTVLMFWNWDRMAVICEVVLGETVMSGDSLRMSSPGLYSWVA